MEILEIPTPEIQLEIFVDTLVFYTIVLVGGKSNSESFLVYYSI